MNCGDGSQQGLESGLYEIRVQGRLDPRWADSLQDMAFAFEGGVTTLTGPLVDQAALHGVLARLRDLGLPIVSVQHLRPDTKPITREETT